MISSFSLEWKDQSSRLLCKCLFYQFPNSVTTFVFPNVFLFLNNCMMIHCSLYLSSCWLVEMVKRLKSFFLLYHGAKTPPKTPKYKNMKLQTGCWQKSYYRSMIVCISKIQLNTFNHSDDLKDQKKKSQHKDGFRVLHTFSQGIQLLI